MVSRRAKEVAREKTCCVIRRQVALEARPTVAMRGRQRQAKVTKPIPKPATTQAQLRESPDAMTDQVRGTGHNHRRTRPARLANFRHLLHWSQQLHTSGPCHGTSSSDNRPRRWTRQSPRVHANEHASGHGSDHATHQHRSADALQQFRAEYSRTTLRGVARG